MSHLKKIEVVCKRVVGLKRLNNFAHNEPDVRLMHVLSAAVFAFGSEPAWYRTGRHITTTLHRLWLLLLLVRRWLLILMLLVLFWNVALLSLLVLTVRLLVLLLLWTMLLTIIVHWLLLCFLMNKLTRVDRIAIAIR